MIAPVAPSRVSPLGELARDVREQVVAALLARLAPPDVASVLAALAGSQDDVRALPFPLQEQARDALLNALPAGLNAVVVSQLGEAWS